MLRSVKVTTVGNSANASMHFLLEAVIAASDGGQCGDANKAKQKLQHVQMKHRNTKAKRLWKTVARILL